MTVLFCSGNIFKFVLTFELKPYLYANNVEASFVLMTELNCLKITVTKKMFLAQNMNSLEKVSINPTMFM